MAKLATNVEKVLLTSDAGSRQKVFMDITFIYDFNPR